LHTIPPESIRNNGWWRLRSQRKSQGHVRLRRSRLSPRPPTPYPRHPASPPTPAAHTYRIHREDNWLTALNRWHIGSWGNPYEGGGRPGKGVVTYVLSPNRQRPMATFISKGFWNVCRRSKNQVLYFIPPLVLGYATMQWAIER
jgi:ubiquinol-cytochrome c reductase subunit 8